MESLPGNDISGWRLEDLGVALRYDTKLCTWFNVDGEVDLTAANKPASVGQHGKTRTLF